jgi:molybdenum cofactor biosynthesis protein B
MKDTSSTHKASAPRHASFAIVTVSTTRTQAEDGAGDEIQKLLESNGHIVAQRHIVPDNKDVISARLDDLLAHSIDCIIFNGGTGLARSDVTIEAVKPRFAKEISGFGIMFNQQSYQEIGTAAMLSRATAGLIGNKAVFCLPGSPRACRLAVEKLILPEIGHILKHLKD